MYLITCNRRVDCQPDRMSAKRMRFADILLGFLPAVSVSSPHPALKKKNRSLGHAPIRFHVQLPTDLLALLCCGQYLFQRL
jgi:hypothetical protein